MAQHIVGGIAPSRRTRPTANSSSLAAGFFNPSSLSSPTPCVVKPCNNSETDFVNTLVDTEKVTETKNSKTFSRQERRLMLTTNTGTTAARTLKVVIALIAATLLQTAARAEMSVLPSPVMDEPGAAPSNSDAAYPAYHVVQGISDGVFNFMRQHVLGSILPDRLTRNLKAAPQQDSAPLFDRTLHENETRFLARASAAYPVTGDGVRPANAAQLQAWRSWATGEQVSVAIDSFKDTMISRYQLELFGAKAGAYANDRRNWDPGFLTMAGILGSTFMYVNGMHASTKVAGFKLGLDLPSGMKLRQALENKSDTNKLAGVELGYKNSPLTVATEWGRDGGRFKNERVGVNYTLRY